MPIPDDFRHECLYSPDAWYVHDLLEVDETIVRAVCDTTQLGALVDAQRQWPAHPKHMPAAISVQITGTLGIMHAVYGLGMRPTEGWSGFGTHVQGAKFPSMGKIGPEVELVGKITRNRTVRGTVFIDYDFTYTQEGRVVFQSKQTAGWVRGEHRGPCPE